MSLTMADGVETARGSQGQNSLLRKQLALAVKSVQWSYAVFWSSSSTQSGVLEWGEGCYNGDIRKRKKRCEAHYKYGLHRSKQLRKLYLSMLEGDIPTTTTTTTTISTAHHDHYDHKDDDDDDCNSRLSPDDLSDEEWYYLVSMSYVFSPSQCLPGRALAMGETIWLYNAQYAENKFFSRSLLARSASIQTVVCFPYFDGVIELGVTELISEDRSLIQHIKSCLFETSKPDSSLNNFSAKQDKDDDEKNQMRIKIIGEGNSVVEENHQIPLNVADYRSDEDLHYKRTVTTVLKYEKNDKSTHQRQPKLVSFGSSFLWWKPHEQPTWNLSHKQSNFQTPSQNVLRKILHDVPLMHSADTKKMIQSQGFGMNQSNSTKENDKFSVLRTMVATTVNEVDKESILNNTINYLQELEARVEELESCMGSVNFVERQRKTTQNFNDSVLIEETSGNYDDSTNVNGNSGAKTKVNTFKDETNLRIELKETEVVIEVRCSYRDYIVADIMETLSNLHIDAFSVRSHTLNGILTLNLKAKFRGGAVASVGMIKRELRRLIGESMRIT